MMWNFKAYGAQSAAIDENGNTLTYGELDAACKQFQVAVGTRCLIFCLCGNTLGSLLGYVASIQGHIVPLLLDACTDANLLKQLLEIYRPRYLWLPENCGCYEEGQDTGFSMLNYHLVSTGYCNSPPLFDGLALLLTTSGSTGSPKLVRQSYRNIESNTRSIVDYLRLSDAEKAITTLPMNYTYGLSIINSHLYVGATILMTEKTMMQKEFWVFFRSQGATSFGGVPYTYEILKKLRFANMALPSLRSMTQAGGKLGAELHTEFAALAREKGLAFFIMYGACEATARMSYLPSQISLEKAGSIGIAIPNGKLEIMDSQGNPVITPHVVGELVYYGDNVTLGYASSAADLVKGDERGGRLETGDMGYFDEDGCFFITGRKSRFLKVYGNRFSLDEAEKIIKLAFPGIDLVCAGKDDLVIIFVTNGKEHLKAIRDHISQATRLNASAFKVMEIDEIPRNSAGKIIYSQLENHYV